MCLFSGCLFIPTCVTTRRIASQVCSPSDIQHVIAVIRRRTFLPVSFVIVQTPVEICVFSIEQVFCNILDQEQLTESPERTVPGNISVCQTLIISAFNSQSARHIIAVPPVDYCIRNLFDHVGQPQKLLFRSGVYIQFTRLINDSNGEPASIQHNVIEVFRIVTPQVQQTVVFCFVLIEHRNCLLYPCPASPLASNRFGSGKADFHIEPAFTP